LKAPKAVVLKTQMGRMAPNSHVDFT